MQSKILQSCSKKDHIINIHSYAAGNTNDLTGFQVIRNFIQLFVILTESEPVSNSHC